MVCTYHFYQALATIMDGMTQGYGTHFPCCGIASRCDPCGTEPIRRSKKSDDSRGGIFFCWFGLALGDMEKLCPGDAIVEEK